MPTTLCHLHDDDPAQVLSGAAPRLFWEKATEDGGRTTDAVPPSPRSSVSGLSSPYSGHWKLIIEATMFVTNETVLVWSGVKLGGNDPVGIYTRVAGCDPTDSFGVEVL